MKRATFGLIATVVLLATLARPAATHAQDRSLKLDLNYILKDSWQIVEAPFHGSSKDWQTAGLVIGGAAALTFVDQPVLDWMRAHPNSIPMKLIAPFRMGNPSHLESLGWTKVLLPVSALALGAGLALDDNNLRDAGLGCITSNIATTVPRRLVTIVIGRLRPENNRGPYIFELLGPGWDMRSFPGGHASNIMSCATFLNNRFDTGIAEIPIYIVAGGVGMARIADEQHWTSDTFTGIAYGVAVGREVAARFVERDLRRKREQSLQPGLVLGARIRF